MSSEENSIRSGNPITGAIGTSIAVEKAQDGKIRMSVEDFARVFARAIAPLAVQELHADPTTFKTNPVTPGVGSRVIDATTWFKRYLKSAKDSGDDWEERALTPRRDPILAAIANNEKRIDRLKEAEDQEKWLKTMQKKTANDVFEGILAVKAAGYVSGVEAKQKKASRAIQTLQPLTESLAKALDQLSTATKKDRGDKMLAARDGMIAIGEKLRGITPE